MPCDLLDYATNDLRVFAELELARTVYGIMIRASHAAGGASILIDRLKLHDVHRPGVQQNREDAETDAGIPGVDESKISAPQGGFHRVAWHPHNGQAREIGIS